MRPIVHCVCAALILAFMVVFVSCGGNDLLIGSSTLPPVTASAGPTETPCVGSGGGCVFTTDCCEGLTCVGFCQ